MTNKLIDVCQLRVEVLKQAKHYMYLQDMAKALNICSTNLGGILSGKRTPGPSELQAFGYRRITLYQKIEDE